MKYCRRCNVQCDDSTAFCGKCGSNEFFNIQNMNLVNQEKEVGPWKVFAMIGMIFGIVSIAFAGISILGSLLLLINTLL